MRPRLSSVGYLLLAAGGLFALDRALVATRAMPPGDADVAADRAGIAAMLRERRHDVSLLVIGTAAGDLRDFRGSLTGGGRNRPFWGEARRTCSGGASTARCWSLSRLDIDGKQIHPVPAPPKPPARKRGADADPARPATPKRARAAAPTVSGRAARKIAPPSRPIDAAPPGTGARAAPSPAGPPEKPARPAGRPDAAAATHTIALPRINTRSGPGIEHPVVLRLKSGARLALVEGRDAWGRFRIVGGANDGREIWAAFHILQALD